MGSERKGDYKAFGWSRRGRCCHLLRQEGLYEGERQAGAVVGVCGHSSDCSFFGFISVEYESRSEADSETREEPWELRREKV